jgi:hypothetical protein
MLNRYAYLLLVVPVGLVALDACSARSDYKGGGRKEFANAKPDDTTTPPDEDSGNTDPPDTGTDPPDTGTIRDAGADGG